MSRVALALALALSLAAPAAAQIYRTEDDLCRTQTFIPGVGANTSWRYDIDPRASADWVRSFNARDQRMMQQIAGTYYFEAVIPNNGQQFLQRSTFTYDATGSFAFSDQTCVMGPYASCSPNQGYGRWAANPQGNGVVFIARNFSDMNRLNQCGGFFARLAPDGNLIDPRNGALLLRRMR